MTIRHFQGAILIGLFIALSIIMWRTLDGLYAGWINSDTSPWYNGFLTDHLWKWRMIFETALVVFLAWPGMAFLLHKPTDKGQLWKRDGGWGEWR